jgi:hypothetical protein
MHDRFAIQEAPAVFGHKTRWTCIVKTRCLPWRGSLFLFIGQIINCAGGAEANVAIRIVVKQRTATADEPLRWLCSLGYNKALAIEKER